MKQFIKYAAVGLAGYFVGFYEMKYKVLKIIALKDCKKHSNKSEEEESK